MVQDGSEVTGKTVRKRGTRKSTTTTPEKTASDWHKDVQSNATV